jgi:hypothetical protein
MCFWQSAQNVHYILYIPQAHKSPSFGFRIAGALPRLFSNCAGRRGIRTILYPVRFKLIGTKIYLVDSPVIEKWVLRVWRGVGGGSRDVCQSVTMRSNQQIQSIAKYTLNIDLLFLLLFPLHTLFRFCKRVALLRKGALQFLLVVSSVKQVEFQ